MHIPATKSKVFIEKPDSELQKLELYRLIGDGYKAMEEGRESILEEVVGRLEKRRQERRS